MSSFLLLQIVLNSISSISYVLFCVSICDVELSLSYRRRFGFLSSIFMGNFVTHNLYISARIFRTSCMRPCFLLFLLLLLDESRGVRVYLFLLFIYLSDIISNNKTTNFLSIAFAKIIAFYSMQIMLPFIFS